MESSKKALERIVTAVDNLKHLEAGVAAQELNDDEKKKPEDMKQFRGKFEDAMDDDLNTADAIAAVFDLVKFANTESQMKRVPDSL